MTQTAPQTVPYEVWQREHALRIQAEKDRDRWKNEFYLSRNLRRAPVLRPVDKDVLEEFRHVQKWGTVEDPEGNKRANFKTIANHLHISPDTVARSAERLEKLQLADIREHQGPQDERERKYIQVKEEKLATIDTLEDPEQVVPKQGGNRYICPKCDSTDVAIRTVKTLHCNKCQHEEVVEDEWKMQNGHKVQKQLAFKKSKHAQEQNTESSPPEKQLGDHSVYTQGYNPQPAQKQLAFEELQALPQWVCWRYGKPDKNGKLTKVPFIANNLGEWLASTTKSSTWRSWEVTRTVYEKSQSWKGTFTLIDKDTNEEVTYQRKFDGVGFVFNHNGIVGIDEDNNLDPPRVHSYTELSVSETGKHTFARGSIPKGVRRNGIEMYDSGRFFTWTGNHLAGTPETIEDCQAELDALYKELAPETIPIQPAPVHLMQCIRDDEEILDKARNGKNGSGETFRRLYDEGNWSGYPSQSEADLWLFEKLLYYADGNVSTSCKLFEKSGLMRPKWERDDYRERTINRALAMWQRRERRAS